EAQLANATLAKVRAVNLVDVTEANLRILMHLAPGQALDVGEDLEAELPKATFEAALATTALSLRPELKAIDAQIASAKSSAEVASAGMYPKLDLVGNAYYSNPNNRYFPTLDQWKATWDIGVVLSWSPTDALIASDQNKAASANVATLEATREQIADAVVLSVTNAAAKVKEMDQEIVAAAAEVRASEEEYRVRRTQFLAGAATSALLVDAEADLTRARLNLINARADQRIARAELALAMGKV